MSATGDPIDRLFERQSQRIAANEAPSCITCRYSQVDHDTDAGFEDGPLLRCHRYPPTVFALDGDACQSWPNVNESNWCGEYAAGVDR